MSEPALNYFIVHAPDYTEEGTFERRMSVREKHLERAKGYLESGEIKVAGGMLTPDSIATPTSPKKIIGSTFIFHVKDINVVKDWIESDLYYTSGIWDKERLSILPFLPANKFN